VRLLQPCAQHERARVRVERLAERELQRTLAGAAPGTAARPSTAIRHSNPAPTPARMRASAFATFDPRLAKRAKALALALPVELLV
jgi:hypothetical protein